MFTKLLRLKNGEIETILRFLNSCNISQNYPSVLKSIKKEVVMIRKSMTIMFALLLLITAGTVIGAEMAKEGS
jgi:hypothetical protein